MMAKVNTTNLRRLIAKLERQAAQNRKLAAAARDKNPAPVILSAVAAETYARIQDEAAQEIRDCIRTPSLTEDIDV